MVGSTLLLVIVPTPWASEMLAFTGLSRLTLSSPAACTPRPRSRSALTGCLALVAGKAHSFLVSVRARASGASPCLAPLIVYCGGQRCCPSWSP